MRTSNWPELTDRILLPVGIAILESTWLYVLLTWLQRKVAAPNPVLPLLSLPLLLLAGVIVGRLLLGTDLPLHQVRRLTLAAGALAVLLALWSGFNAGLPPWHPAWLLDFTATLGIRRWGSTIPPQWFALLAALYLWWRGLRAGRSEQAYLQLRATFFVGLTLLILLNLIAAWDGLLLPDDLLVPLLVYFTVALLTLALAAVERARRHGHAATGTWLGLNQYWLGTVGAGISLVITGGLLLGWLIAPQRFAVLLAPIAALFVALAIGIAFLAGWLYGQVYRLLENSPDLRNLLTSAVESVTGFEMPEFFESRAPDNIAELVAQDIANFVANSPAIQVGSRILALVSVLAVAALVVWWVMQRIRRHRVALVSETRESIATRDLLARQLRAMLRQLVPQGSRRHRDAPYLPLDGPASARQRIRLAYQGLLAWAARHALTRDAALTPRQYAVVLRHYVPEAAADLDTLTAAYDFARYGSSIPASHLADDAVRALQHIETLEPHAPATLD